MEFWNGSVFPNSTGLMGPLGLLISWLLVLVAETVVPPTIITGEVNLGGVLEVFLSCGIVPFVSFRFTAAGSWKTCAPMCAASVTITFEEIVWHACAVPLPATPPSEIGGIIGGMMTRMVRFINNFCGGFLLVVSVSVTFLLFTSLV